MANDAILMAGAPSGLKNPDGVRVGIERIGAQGDRMISQLHGKMYEQADRGMLFHGGNQAAVTTTIALATTYTGLCLSNPAGNLKKFALRQVGISLAIQPAAATAFALGGGYAAAGITAHGSALIAYPMNLGGSIASTAKIDDGCTLLAGAGAGLLRVIMPLGHGMEAAAGTFFGGVSVTDIEGAIVLIPGAFVFVYTLTVQTGAFFAFSWEEMPL